MSCTVRRNIKGQIERVFNPIQVDKSKAVTELLVEHLRQNLGQDVIVDKNLFSSKLEELGFKDIEPNIIGRIGADNLPIAMENYYFAEELEKQGKSAREIYNATGWERTSDKGKWKYGLIQSNLAKIKLNDFKGNVERSIEKSIFKRGDEKLELSNVVRIQGNLEDIIENYDEILTAYPQLRKLRLQLHFHPAFSVGPEGYYASIGNIENNFIYMTAASMEHMKNGILHEIQHAIQDIEGFAKGGNPETAFAISMFSKHDTLVNTNRRYADLWFGASNIINTIVATDGKDKEASKRLRVVRDEMFRIINETYGEITPEDSFNLYSAIAGEIEARNAEKRSKLTLEQLKNEMLGDTEDVAEEAKIFIYKKHLTSSEAFFLKESPLVEPLMTKAGELYGFAAEGKIYLDPDLLNSNTLFHEFSHITDKQLEQAAASGDKQAETLINKRNSIVDPIVNEVKKYLSQIYGKNVTNISFEPQVNQVITDGNSKLVYSEFSDSIGLDLIETPLEERGQGKAKSLLNKLKSKADTLLKPITLMVSPRDGNTDFDKLVNLYKNAGFQMQKVNGIESDFEMIYYPDNVDFQVLSKFRDNKNFAFSDLVYPDVVFKDIKTEAQARIAINFYNKIINKFNKLFDRELKLDTKVSPDGNFNVVVTYETGLQPKYFAYPTSTIGQHEVVGSIDKNVPLTSLRHELIHEMLVKHITDKFERINNLDNSANAESIEDVQRNRAYNYSLEDVFFERIVENIERNPDFVDTFPINTFGIDVTNRLKVELADKELTKDNVMTTLNSLLEGSNEWLTTTLNSIFDKLNFSNITDISDMAEQVGKSIEDRFNISKNIFPDELQSKIFEFTELFNAEYKGVLTRLGKQQIPGVVPGNRLFNEPLPDASRIAAKLMGEKFVKPTPITTIDKTLSKRISDAYEQMKHDPTSPDVKAAYEAMVNETLEQYNAIVEEGYSIELSEVEPYSSSEQMLDDLRVNKNMKVMSTMYGYGDTKITEEDLLNNPLLADTELKDINGKKLLVNDVFRFVHDFFGHAELGNGFGPIGEENAWRIHSQMYSSLARRAMTTETRGQNSYVNFSGVNDEAFKLRNEARKLRSEGKTEQAAKISRKVGEMMKFAEQKIGLLPEEFSETSVDISNNYGISSPVYAQKQNETDEQWTNRLRGEVWARMIGEEGDRIASEVEKELGLEKGSIMSKIKQWLNDLVNWIKNNLSNFRGMSNDDILKMSMKEFIRTSAADMLVPKKLLAPNGKPSNLNPQQYAQVRTPEFKAWFGDWEKGIFTNEAKLLEYKHKTGSGRQNLLDIEYLYDENDSKNIEIAKNISKLQNENNSIFDNMEKDVLGGKTVNFDEFVKTVNEKYKEIFSLVDSLEQNSEVKKVKDSLKYFTSEGINEWIDYKNKGISKVVDENGEPMVVYHGTTSSFNEFRGSQFFFSKDKLPDFGPEYLNVFLNLRKPYILNDADSWQNINISKKDENWEEIYNELSGDTIFIENVVDWAKTRGYDGVIAKNITEGLNETMNTDDFIAINPNQIKSATTNNGQFSTTNDNINMEVRAFHGSPFKFDRFSTDAIGNGEGAQAFGWGLYFTDLKSIGKAYAKTLATTTYDGKDLSEVEIFDKILSSLDSTFEGEGGFFNLDKGSIYNLEKFKKYVVDTIEYLENYYNNIDENSPKVVSYLKKYVDNNDLSDLRQDIDIYNQFKSISESQNNDNKLLIAALPKFKQRAESAARMILELNRRQSTRAEDVKRIVDRERRDTKSSLNMYKYILRNFDKLSLSRNLYKVSINKGKNPSEYTWLEWDKPVSNSIKKLVKNKLSKEEYERGFYDKIDSLKISQERFIRNGEALYEGLTLALGSAKSASLFLLENGIDGVKYPAESISRGTNSETARGFNYVVFDENAVTIEDRVEFQIEEAPIESSELFETIRKFPHLESQEQALQAYTNIFTDKFKSEFGDWMADNTPSPLKYAGGEPRLFFRNMNGDVFNDFASALKGTNEGEIEAGFIGTKDINSVNNVDDFEVASNDVVVFNDAIKLNDQESFLPIMAIPSDINTSTITGYINKMIKLGYVSPELKIVDGEARLIGNGASMLKVSAMTDTAVSEALAAFGPGSVVTYPDGTFTIKPLDFSSVVINGTSYSKSELEKKLINNPSSLKRILPSIGSFAFHMYMQAKDSLFGTSKKRRKYSDAEITTLKTQLMGLLKSLGISTTTILEYSKNYKQRHGVDLSVDALVDMANNVVAFAEGKDTVENLSEETAHIIIEAYTNQAEVEQAMEGIEETKEWQDFSSDYYDRYSKMYQGIELDRVVRREILGKILANQIITRFRNNQNSTLKNIFDKFVEMVRSFFTASHKKQLNSFVSKAADMVLSGNMEANLDTELVTNSALVMYNTGSNQANTFANRSVRLEAQIEKLKQSLELRRRTQQQLNDPEVSRITSTINKLENDLSNNDLLAAAAAGNNIHENQIVHLERQLAAYSNNTGATTPFFNVSDQTTYNYLRNVALPIMKEMRGLLVGVDQLQVTRLDSQIQRINNLEGSVFAQQSNDADAVVNAVVDLYNLPDEEREAVKRSFTGVQKDVSGLQALFGQLGHAANSFLNLLGKIINRNYYHAEIDTFNQIDRMVNMASDGKWNMSRLRNLIKRTPEGKNSGYLLAPINYAKFEKDKADFIADLYNDILTQDQKDSLNGAKPNKSILTDDQLREFVRRENEWRADNEERAMLPQYYTEMEDMFTQAGIGVSNRAFLSELSARTYRIKSRYRDANGLIDYSQMTQSDLDALAQIAIERKARKSDYDAVSGLKKTGTELQEAQELQRLDELRSQLAIQRGTSDDFFQALAAVESANGSQAAFEFLMANGGIVFSDTFWDSMTTNGSMQDRVNDAMNEFAAQGDTEAINTLMSAFQLYADATEARKQILKQFSSPNNPAEINATLMPEAAMKNILELEETIQDNSIIINSQFRKLGMQPVPAMTENTLNEAYQDALQDSGKTELEFIQDHMSASNKYKFTELKRRLERIENGRSDYMEPGFKRFITAQYGIDAEDIIQVRDLITRVGSEDILLRYGRDRAASYFKRFAPMGYENLLNDLKNGNVSVTDTVNRIRRGDPAMANYSISTKFEWADTNSTNSMINPNFVADTDSGFSRPRVDKYRDDEYYNRFNPDANGVATTNVEEWNMIQEFKSTMRTILDNYGENNRNVYKLPMVGKTSVEKTLNLNARNIKESVKDFIYNREDDMQYGARIDGVDVREMGARIIPKYYLTDLESNEDISDDLVYSYVMMMRESNLYKRRVETIGEIMVIQQRLEHSTFENGKTPEATNTYKMFKEFVDGYFYGVKSSKKKMISILGKEVDASKMARGIDNWIRKVNVGFSLPIALSSAVVSNINFAIENAVGEHVHPGSSKWATAELAKLMKDYASNYGNVNRKDKLYLLGQTFGFHSAQNKAENASYNKIIKAMSDLPFAAMSIFSTPHQNNILLSILDDFRLVGDRFFTYNEFRKKAENNGLTDKEVRAKWDTYKENSMYNLLEEKDGAMNFKQEVLDNIGEIYANEQILRARTKIVEVNGNVDALISETDKSAATRHYLWNFVTAHRGWLGIGIQRRFKKKHFNFNTGEFEEGHYRSFAKLINDVFRLTRQEGLSKFVKVVKEEWGNLTEVEKRNMKRISRDMAAFAILTALSVIVARADDDEDNKDNWAMHFLSYIYFRTVSETASSQAPAGVYDAIDVVKTPFVAVNSVQSLLDGLSGGFDEVQSGPYEGHSKIFQALIKQTWLRHGYDLAGVKQKSDYFRLLNKGTLFMAQKISKDEQEEENLDNQASPYAGYFDRGVRE